MIGLLAYSSWLVADLMGLSAILALFVCGLLVSKAGQGWVKGRVGQVPARMGAPPLWVLFVHSVPLRIDSIQSHFGIMGPTLCHAAWQHVAECTSMHLIWHNTLLCRNP